MSIEVADALTSARALFWRSALRYYGTLVMPTGSSVAAWDAAKERLLRAAERCKAATTSEPAAGEDAAPPENRCPACGILQEGRAVCAECVALYGSAEAALIRAHYVPPAPDLFAAPAAAAPQAAWPKPAEERPLTRKEDWIARRAASHHATRERRRAALRAKMRALLLERGAMTTREIAEICGVSGKTAQLRLVELRAGCDGEPPLPLQAANGGDWRWRVMR